MVILICVLVAFAAFAFWKSKTPKHTDTGGSTPSDGPKPDKV